MKGLLNPATTGLFRGILGLGEALAMSPKLLFYIVGRASRSQKMYIDRLLFREVKEKLATAGTSSGKEFLRNRAGMSVCFCRYLLVTDTGP